MLRFHFAASESPQRAVQCAVLTSQFLYYYTRSNAFVSSLTKLVSGVMYPAVTDRQVLQQPIWVPDIVEQRKATDLLARAENIVRMRKAAEAKAKEIVPALFQDGFGDHGTRTKGRREAVRTIPLADLADVVSGVAKGRKLGAKATREVPYLRTANVQAGYLNLEEMKRIPATENEIGELAVKAGDVLLTEGGDFDKVGRGALLEMDIGECIHQNHVFRVRVRSNYLTPEYFAAFLQTDGSKQYLLKAAKKTSNLASINMTQLKALPVPVPPIAEQGRFSEQFRELRRMGEQQRVATERAQVAFQSLLAQVFGREA